MGSENERSKVEIGVIGTVQGWSNTGEELRTAALRLVVEAEQSGNAGIARLHLELKDEPDPLPGQSRMAGMLAKTVAKRMGEDKVGERLVAEDFDRELAQIRAAFEFLPPCPVVSHHGPGPCSFCVAYAMRDVLMFEGTPTETPCRCPNWWFPEARREQFRAMDHGPALAHHEQCPKRWLKPEVQS
jgi:hypothetical protein